MFRNKSDEMAISRVLGYQFKDKTLLLRALTRTSAIQEGLQLRKINDNQSLEFLGDSVLDLIISDILFTQHPDWSEGKLTQKKSKYVNNSGPIAAVAFRLQLDNYLIMGRGEELLELGKSTKVLSDAMEALIGALWLDTGRDYQWLQAFVEKHWFPIKYSDIAEELRECLMDEKEVEKTHLETLTSYLNDFVEPDDINQVLLAVVEYSDNPNFLKLVLTYKPSDEALNTALILSIVMNSEQAVTLLLAAGANANKIYRYGEKDAWDESGYEAFVYYRGSEYSALQMAVLEGDVGIVKSLLHYKADPNWDKGTAWRRESQPAFNAEDMVLAKNELASFISSFSPLFSNEDTSLNELMRRKKQTREALKNGKLQRPKKVSYTTERNVLHVMAECPYGISDAEEIMNLLVDASCDINKQDYEGNTPLLAALHNESVLVDALLKHAPDLSIQNKKNDSAQQFMTEKNKAFGCNLFAL